MALHCQRCENIGLDCMDKSVYTSKRIDQDSNNHSSFDLNLRMSSAFTYMGVGYAALEQIGMFLNMPVFCVQLFEEHLKKIHASCTNVVNRCMQSARSLSKNLLEDSSDSQDPMFVNSTVSFDGSWLTRGHKSKFGFASVIDFNKQKPGEHAKNIKTQIKPEYLIKLLPIYERLSADDLLKRCVGCKTQN